MIGNWLDLIIIFYLVVHFIDGIKRGFYSIIVNMVSFMISIVIALFTYSVTAKFFVSNFGLEQVYSNIAGFFLNMFFIKLIFLVLIRKKLPASLFVIDKCFRRRISSGFASFLYSSFVVFILLSITLSFSLPFIFKNEVASSSSGRIVVNDPIRINSGLKNIFGDVISATMDKLDFLTVGAGDEETIKLGYTTTDVTIDKSNEYEMLLLVNKERESRGIAPLIADETVRQVARKHGMDMFAKGYFSHINLEDLAPADRMKEGNVEFSFSGENLALSKDLASAHQGLMNSKGHKKNILQPFYHRVGIGVIDGGKYGKIFVQDFAD